MTDKQFTAYNDAIVTRLEVIEEFMGSENSETREYGLKLLKRFTVSLKEEKWYNSDIDNVLKRR